MTRPLLFSGILAGALGAAAVLASPVAATAQRSAPMPTAMPPMNMPVSGDDYVSAAGESDQFEIQSGRLAAQMGGSPGVKRFGEKMISDHTDSTQMVGSALMQSGRSMAPPPPPLRADHQQMLAQLQGMSGMDFDKMYVTQQLLAHQEALMVQQGYAAKGDDPNLRAAASKIVPVVKMHIAMLKRMDSHM